MNLESDLHLEIHQTPGADIHTETRAGSWHLEIPAGPQGSYRLAQLDDYTPCQREGFPWHPPLTLSLRARVSECQAPGTWGFGLWNDPFSISLGLGGGTRRFPALPNAAWFFFSSPQNYLSFRDDLPANGFLAQTFHAPKIPAPILALVALGMPLLLWPWIGRRLRPGFRRLIAEDSFALNVDVTQWHSYTLEWHEDRVAFKVDDQTFQTRVTPKAPLGLVIWIDNQYAAFHPHGKLAYGTLENIQPAWLEIESFSLHS
jgi:hypothetical protein